MTYERFNARVIVRRLLRERKMTQHQLAVKAGLSDGDLSRWLNVQTNRVSVEQRVLSALGVTIEAKAK